LVATSYVPNAGKTVFGNNGVRIVADADLKTLAHAGTISCRRGRTLKILRHYAARCTAPCASVRHAARFHLPGVFILAAAGLLDGCRATAHWAQTELLPSRYPAVQVDPNALHIDDGDIMSSAGRAAGLDLCLYIVRRDYGAGVANRVVQRLIVPPHCEGGQAQFIPRPVHKADGDMLGEVFAWAQRHLDHNLTIASLASKARMSRHTFIRRFKEATGLSPGEWVVRARVSRARELLEETQVPVEGVATATGCGSAYALRHHFRLRLVTSPADYRAAFRAPGIVSRLPSATPRPERILSHCRRPRRPSAVGQAEAKFHIG
jgi:AraC family transcriptional regulator, transcriptional activator FtrA